MAKIGNDFEHVYVGRKVVYQGGHLDDRDEGVVTSVNHKYVFARFGGGTTSAACDPASLTFLDGTKPDLTAHPANVAE